MKYALFALCLFATPTFAQLPILTEAATTLGRHRVNFGLGVEYYHRHRPADTMRRFPCSAHLLHPSTMASRRT